MLVRVQVMERLCVRVQQQVCLLKGCEDGEDVQTARQILKEARDSRAVSEKTGGPVSVRWFHPSVFQMLTRT